MNNLASVFEKGKVIIPYLTFGDPSIELSEQLAAAAFDSGAGIVELGIPFSDPIADGPVIQASHQRALDANPHISLDDAFACRRRLKERYAQPVVFMLSVNLVFCYGIDRFFESAAASGLDGVIIPDLPVEEAALYLVASKRTGVSIVFLVSHLCDPKRLPAIVQASEGFVYLISSVGVTGERAHISSDLEEVVMAIKAVKDIPVAVGFGVSSREHVTCVNGFADGAIVGSHLIKRMMEGDDPVVSLRQEIVSLLG